MNHRVVTNFRACLTLSFNSEIDDKLCCIVLFCNIHSVIISRTTEATRMVETVQPCHSQQ